MKKINTELKGINLAPEKQLQEPAMDLTKKQVHFQLGETKYQKIVEEAGDCVYSTDYNGNFTYLNPMCLKLTGYTEKELLGENFLKLISPDWKENVAKLYKDQFDKKIQESSFSFPIITKTGEKKWVEQIVTLQKEEDKIIGLYAIVRDITQGKKEEEKLKEYKYFLTTAMTLCVLLIHKIILKLLTPTFKMYWVIPKKNYLKIN